KIVDDAQLFINQAIKNDLEMLENYKMHLLDALPCPESEKSAREKLIDRFLFPINAELKGIAMAKMDTDDLHAFFIWKTNVDERRNALVELALLTVDGLLQDNTQNNTIIRAVSEEDEQTIEIEEVDQKLQEYSYILSILSHLESQSKEYISQ